MTKDFKNLKNKPLATRVKFKLKLRRAASHLNYASDFLNPGDPRKSAWELPCGSRETPRCRKLVFS
ncbi:hypothetical protein HanRHA438_Chr14g0675321 [Helianthus annuus]|nr:hypothetical protein HanHA89_Chr14g0589041 [Helianthus annuus]KAJ0630596.1 hypothetical protein HanHA300_Chr00c0184g0725751 [Helianthus annuus]KAJ0661430.1 hypothetical protein HanOQP8_Chr14g0548421 [Helianthus annuus]KAJ0855622.1 hypothetical protein HanRHA438_Chr14g0675321 [Helianthus annuus]